MGQLMAGAEPLGRRGDPVGVARPGLAGRPPHLLLMWCCCGLRHTLAVDAVAAVGDDAAEEGAAAALVAH